MQRGSAIEAAASDDETVVVVQDGVALNAAGHRDQLSRQYGFFGLASMALTVDNAWIALGSSISVSIREYRSSLYRHVFVPSCRLISR